MIAGAIGSRRRHVAGSAIDAAAAFYAAIRRGRSLGAGRRRDRAGARRGRSRAAAALLELIGRELAAVPSVPARGSPVTRPDQGRAHVSSRPREASAPVEVAAASPPSRRLSPQ